MADLKPCPFCCSPAKAGVVPLDCENGGGHFVACTNRACGASTNLRFATGDDPAPLQAEQWNRRTHGKSEGEIGGIACTLFKALGGTDAEWVESGPIRDKWTTAVASSIGSVPPVADPPACWRCSGTGKEDGRDHCEACNPPDGVGASDGQTFSHTGTDAAQQGDKQ